MEDETLGMLMAAVAVAALGGGVEELTVTPRPAIVRMTAGSFAARPGLRVVWTGGGAVARRSAPAVAEALTAGCGFAVASGGAPGQAGVVRLMPPAGGEQPGTEGYALSVTHAGAVIRAAGPAGFLYGAQTLRQMAATGADGVRIPCAEIEDRPRFAWRGLMLDCSRTFQRLAYLRRTIDLLALYKMNVLHLHLTDDQGWRLEIRSHPLLTGVGARFSERFKEPAERQGFYTRSEMRDLIAYAARRGVTIVPEIEMPGHCNATLAAYPDLSCTGGKYEVYPYGVGPGIQTDVLCPGNERGYRVMEDVLSEVITLFPSLYIHIGGDECPKDRWKQCPKCQARMRAEGLRSEEELQSYFVRRIGRFIASKARRMIGWDEILEGGLAPGAAVMSWRGTAGGVAAAKAGSAVVMSPTSHCYFDYSYDLISTRQAWSYEPVPEGLTPEQGALVLGAQANMWTHIARTEPEADRQIYPRLLGLAEAVWSPSAGRNWPDFKRRLAAHRALLKSMGVETEANDAGAVDWPAPAPPLPGRVTSSSGAWTVYAPAFAFDGSKTTYYWNDRPIVTGDTVTVTLDAPTRLARVSVLTGRPGVEIARMHHGVLEVSGDGQAWITLCPIADDGSASADPGPRPVRAVRIRATADQGPNWLMVREFTLAPAR